MSSPSIIGERVRTLRLAASISQTTLAMTLSGRAESGNSLVSKIESGRQPIERDTLERLADTLGCTTEYLTAPRYDVLATQPWLRAYADASAKVVESVTADNMVAHEAIHLLDLKVLPDRIPLFDGDANDDYAIERFAEEARLAAGIGSGDVVGNAMRAADRLGCVVLPLSNELGRHLGMSQRIDGVPFVRVSRPRRGEGAVPGDRQRFTVVHELGHLALHADFPPPESAEDSRRIERQAHRFASAFLAPAEPLLDDWQQFGGRVTLSTMAELKSVWGISIKALVVRFQQLGIINSDQSTSLYKQISKRGWNKDEPVPTTNEEPIWFVRAIERRTRGSVWPTSAAAAADITGLSPEHFQRWTDWSLVQEALAEVIPLRRLSKQ